MSDYSQYFLNSASSVVQLELLEITHSQFTQPYYIVRNNPDGIEVTLEDGVTVRQFEYYPIQIQPLGVQDDLDQSLRIDLGDLGEILPVELEAVSKNYGFLEKPKVVYRTYRSDDLTSPLYGPVNLEMIDISFQNDGCSFEARAQGVNINRTGELYRFARFPMMRGFL